MTKKIFLSIFLTASLVLVVSFSLVLGILYEYFTTLSAKELKTEISLASLGVESSGKNYLDSLDKNLSRITWIDCDGTVLFENSGTEAEKMENHLEREEVQKALKNGYGESQRYSSTVFEKSLYAAKKLSDGTILRMSVSLYSIASLALGMIQPILILFAAALILSAVMASRLSARVVKPLNEIDLEHPEENEGYDEISPLLSRIRFQQNEIKSKEKEISRTKEETDVILENMTEGIILIYKNGEIMSMNSSAKKLLSLNDDYTGKNILTATRDPMIQNLFSEALEGKKAEKTLSISSGIYQISAAPIFEGTEENKVRGAAVVMYDVTEKEKSEEERREFSANVSHELKTPLHVISGYAELMKDGLAKEGDISSFSQKIYSESQRMVQLVDDIISLSHLDEGAKDMEWQKVNLLAIADECAKRLSSEAEAMNVSVNVSGEETVVQGISPLLQNAIYNLLDNAIKYNKKGGNVSIEISKKDKDAVICIKDTGIGIPKEDQRRVFERFYRVDKSHSRAIGGTGLGLSIVKHAVLVHHGKINLTSEEGTGTEFTVSLPL